MLPLDTHAPHLEVSPADRRHYKNLSLCKRQNQNAANGGADQLERQLEMRKTISAYHRELGCLIGR